MSGVRIDIAPKHHGRIDEADDCELEKRRKEGRVNGRWCKRRDEYSKIGLRDKAASSPDVSFTFGSDCNSCNEMSINSRLQQ